MTGSPFIADLYFSFQTEKDIYLVMEYLPGSKMSFIWKQKSKKKKLNKQIF